MSWVREAYEEDRKLMLEEMKRDAENADGWYEKERIEREIEEITEEMGLVDALYNKFGSGEENR
jgi:hypothetical protein